MPSSPTDIEELVWKHALLNAYRHEGRADPGAVIGKVLGERPELRPRARELIPVVRQVVEAVNRLDRGEQLRLLEARYPGLLERPARPEERRLPPLPGAVMGRVVTRFPPEPNGYPHIGHAKAAVLDEEYARLYQGRFILRFDDTNPAQERREFYDAIREGLAWLGVKPDLEKNTSDDLERLYQYAERLIEGGCAYVCTCRREEVRRGRAEGLECGCRSRGVEANLEEWHRMFTEYGANEAILRFRGDMRSPNTVMRDPTLFRIVEEPHPLQGDRYRVWPTYDFSAPIEDSLDGVTHALRTKEYELRDELYYRILDCLGLRKPRLIEFSRLELRGTPVSKRKLKPLVEEGLVQGWDDPRLPTLRGLERRGILPEAVREFVLSLGVGKAEATPTWDLLEAVNRKLLDPVAKRLYFVPDPVELVVREAPPVAARLRLHPDRPLGERVVETAGRFHIAGQDAARLQPGHRLRLLELYNIEVVSVRDGRVEAKYIGREVVEGIPKIQWVAWSQGYEFQVLVTGPLFIDGRFNPESLKRVAGLAEEVLARLPAGERVQLVRFGFCRIDRPGVAVLTHR